MTDSDSWHNYYSSARDFVHYLAYTDCMKADNSFDHSERMVGSFVLVGVGSSCQWAQVSPLQEMAAVHSYWACSYMLDFGSVDIH